MSLKQRLFSETENTQSITFSTSTYTSKCNCKFIALKKWFWYSFYSAVCKLTESFIHSFQNVQLCAWNLQPANIKKLFFQIMMQKSFVKFAYKNDINVNIYLLSKIQQTAVFLPKLIQFSKFNDFLWVCWFLGKNQSNFVPPAWKLGNRYYHM